MQLAELADALEDAILVGDSVARGEIDVRSVAFDSRDVGPSDLFCCVPGFTVDGHDFAPLAASRGAAALLCERPVDVDLPQLLVPSVRAAMGPAAALVHGDPSGELAVVGITGTNGKTTASWMVEAICASAGLTTAVSGTVETHVAGARLPVSHTTPEAPELLALLRRMADTGVDVCAMEVSSHALDQRRVDGVRFAVSAFTNLGRDHLDYHASMDDYFAAKATLFDASRTTVAVVNVGNEHGRRIAATTDLPLVTYAVGNTAVETITAGHDHLDGVDVLAVEVTPAPGTLSLVLIGPWGRLPVRLPVGGTFNAENAACAAAVALGLGHRSQASPIVVPPGAIAAGLGSMPPVPGRFEPVRSGQDFGVVVDYAHTPEGVENLLAAARAVIEPGGRLVCVMGCGGDRDREKRPLMGRAAATLADHVVVTSDNPRSEDPQAIIDAILPGMRTGGATWEVEVDRRRAIRRAFESAGPGDLVVVAGKGHETGQDVRGVVHPFDDRVVAREELGRLARTTPPEEVGN